MIDVVFVLPEVRVDFHDQFKNKCIPTCAQHRVNDGINNCNNHLRVVVYNLKLLRKEFMAFSKAVGFRCLQM